MANQSHREMLRMGVEAWNQWRKDHPDIIPDLRNISLRGYYEGYNFSGCDMRDIDMFRCFLDGANFEHADLRNANLNFTFMERANFKGADLRGANMSYSHLDENALESARR